jgi:O-antigen/teichoic acid export membrane protein
MLLRVRGLPRFLLGKNSDPANRSHRRYRRAAWAGITASISRIVSLSASLLTVRLTYRYLGAERYGMWMTITSVVMMLGFADFGMSNGLVNVVADALGRGDRAAAKQAAASAFWMLSAVAVMVLLVAAGASPFIDPSRWLNVHSALAVHESGLALLVFLLCFVLNLPLGAVRGVQTGMQNAFVSNLWNILGSVLSVVALLVVMHLHGGLPLLVLALSGPPLLAMALNGVELFGWSHPELRPAPKAFSQTTARHLLHIGGMFFLLQLAYAVGMQVDNVVIAQILGPASVAAYAIPARLFNLIPSFLVMLSSAMWPAYADALAQLDGPWIRRSFKRVMIGGSAISIAATGILVVFGNAILKVWVGPQVQASVALLLAFGLQCVLHAYLQPISLLLNGLGQLRVQVITALLSAAANLTLSIIFVKLYGIIGVVLGTTVALLLVQVVPSSIVVLRSLNALSPRSEVSHTDELDKARNGELERDGA